MCDFFFWAHKDVIDMSGWVSQPCQARVEAITRNSTRKAGKHTVRSRHPNHVELIL